MGTGNTPKRLEAMKGEQRIQLEIGGAQLGGVNSREQSGLQVPLSLRPSVIKALLVPILYACC